MIEPLNSACQNEVRECTRRYIQQAADYYQTPFQPIEVLFDLKGRAAGMYRRQGKRRWIRYNPYIFAKYFADNLANTVPHEVAHYVADHLYGMKNIRPHGAEWRQVMELFDAPPEVTCRYNLEAIPQRKMTTYNYRCDCTQHRLSSIRHNRLQRKQATYVCRKCRQPLRPAIECSV